MQKKWREPNLPFEAVPNPQTPITVESLYQFDKNMPSTQYFTHHIYCFLRENRELLEQPDYRRLYDEVLDFQHRIFMRKTPSSWDKAQENVSCIAYVADLFNGTKEGFERFSKQQVDAYLDHRRAIWRENEE